MRVRSVVGVAVTFKFVAFSSITGFSIGAGCGFQVTLTDAPPAILDAPVDTALDTMMTIIDGPPIDAAWTVDDCPPTYQEIGAQATRYFLRTSAMSVTDHHEACAADGTHLAVLDTASEAAALRQFVDGTSGLPSNAFGAFVWIGVAQRTNQVSVGSGWISATGAQFPTQFWHSGEPNDGLGIEDGEEQFGAIWRNHDLVADIREDDDMAGLCECDGAPITAVYKDLVD
jgi:hypothetical protein